MSKYELPTVNFSSELVTLAFDLERIRGNLHDATTPRDLLADLHQLFQLLMSVVSARIEGNRTTVYDALEGISIGEGGASTSDSIREIQNILTAMAFIDGSDPAEPITHGFVRELHRISVDGLEREGDPTPGTYRSVDVGISQAVHVPPSHVFLHAEMDDWLRFVNDEVPTARQMIHAAIAHHRFLWIHPFRNGNGRVSRLLTYAMLRHHGFETASGLRAINPTAVFGSDRDGYYSSLAAADDLSNDGAIEWCTFFVRGIHADMERLQKLSDFEFVLDSLVRPALATLVQRGSISRGEEKALQIAAQKRIVKAGDLSAAIPGSPSQRSHAIRDLLERGYLITAAGPRSYKLPITNGPVAVSVIGRLDELDFLPRILREEAR